MALSLRIIWETLNFYLTHNKIEKVDKICVDGLRGGQVIDLLFSGGNTGNEHLKKIYQTLYVYSYKVLFNQVLFKEKNLY